MIRLGFTFGLRPLGSSGVLRRGTSMFTNVGRAKYLCKKLRTTSSDLLNEAAFGARSRRLVVGRITDIQIININVAWDIELPIINVIGG